MIMRLEVRLSLLTLALMLLLVNPNRNLHAQTDGAIRLPPNLADVLRDALDMLRLPIDIHDGVLPPMPEDCTGGLRIILNTSLGAERILQRCTLLRDLLQIQWAGSVDKLNNRLRDEIKERDDRVETARVRLNRELEVYVSQNNGALLLQFRVPNNRVNANIDTPDYVPFFDANVTIRFDLDIRLEIPLNTLPNSLSIRGAMADVGNTRIDGDWLAETGNFLAGIFGASLYADPIQDINSQEVDLTNDINNALASGINPILRRIPSGFVCVQSAVDARSNVTLVFSDTFAPPLVSTSAPIPHGFLVGGNGGSRFIEQPPESARLAGIQVRAGRRVDAIQAVYDTGFGERHGGGGGRLRGFFLQDGEYITMIRGRSGSRIDQISFETNLGQVYGPYGGNGGSPFEIRIPAGYEFAGFSGRSGRQVDALSALIRPVNESYRVGTCDRPQPPPVIADPVDNICYAGGAWGDGRCVNDWYWTCGYYLAQVANGSVQLSSIPETCRPAQPEPPPVLPTLPPPPPIIPTTPPVIAI
jgi:hypothetical protein